jgi:alcohol dehydrogenase class IV
MAEAATLAGYAFLSGRVHLWHAVGHALGGAFHLPHGTACMVLMPAILRHITPAVPESIGRIAHHFQTTAPQLPDTLQSFMHRCGMPRLGQLITTTTDHESLIDLILGEERLIGLAPSAPTRQEWRDIIESGW